MDTKQVIEFLKALGAEGVLEGIEWVRASCLFAPWKHAKGTDSHPSFGIKVGHRPFYHCFACQSKGSLDELVIELVHLSKGNKIPGMDFAEAFRILNQDQDSSEGYKPAPDWGMSHIQRPLRVWPEEWLNSFPDAYATVIGGGYLKHRGVGTHLAQDFEIKYDARRNAICFPVRNRSWKLIGMRGRHLDENAPNRFHDYSCQGNRNSPLWLNAHRVDLSEPLVVVESSFDLLAVYKHYRNVTAPLTASISMGSTNWLKSGCEIICLFDNDAAGKESSRLLYNFIGKDVPVYVLDYPEGTEGEDPDSLGEDALREVLKSVVKL